MGRRNACGVWHGSPEKGKKKKVLWSWALGLWALRGVLPSNKAEPFFLKLIEC
jgi:hypothetical protein